MLTISSIMIRWALREKEMTWTTAQYNFTVGVRGFAILAAWKDRLTKHPPAFLRYMGTGLHAETRYRKVFAGEVSE